MSRFANIFFSDLNKILIEYMILQVCKITDPAKDFRNNANHTIAHFLQHFDFSEDRVLHERLKELSDKLHSFREKLLSARNKLISHSDRSAILSGFALGAASDKEWNEFWLNLQDFVQIVHTEIVGDPPFYICGVAMLSDADSLLKALKYSACFDQLLDGADPALTKKCVDLALAP
jgi:hypothetical protein